MRWWDWAVLVSSCLAVLVGLAQLAIGWWTRPPAGWSINRTDTAGPVTDCCLRPLGEMAMYDVVVTAHGCVLLTGDRERRHWVTDRDLRPGDRLDFRVRWSPEGVEPATVEAEWVSGRDRRTSSERIRLDVRTGRVVRWKRYRAGRLRGAPGRWVEMRRLPEGVR